MRYVWKTVDVTPVDSPEDFKAELIGETEYLDGYIFLRIVLTVGQDRFILKSNNRKCFDAIDENSIDLHEMTDEHKFNKEYCKIKKSTYSRMSTDLRIMKSKQTLKGHRYEATK